jgi:S1-C subfamily serine protease
MLIKLTCPSCGKSTEAPDRVVGKEVRCSCGTSFRVLGLKPDAPAATESRLRPPASSLNPQEPRSRPLAPPPEPPKIQPRPQTVISPSNPPRIPPRPQSDVFADLEPIPRPLAPRPSPTAQRGGTPPWAYAAIGGLGVMSLVLIVVLIRSFIVRPIQPSNAAQGERVLASRSELLPAGDPADAAAARPATGGTLSTAQIVARCEPSVALIKGKASSGTGFLVRRGIVATNAHVIEDEFVSSLEVRFPSAPETNKGPLRARLLYEDRKRDLAFLAVQSELPVLDVAPMYHFQKGEDITVIGNPGLDADTVLENAISRGVMSSKSVIEEMDYFQLNISINPGNSGGPVFDSAGRVIGVATLKASKAEAVAFCIPIEDVHQAMKELGTARPDLTSRHRAEVAFRLLTTAGVVYTIGLGIRSAVIRSSPMGGMNAMQLPTEETRKFDTVLTKLDQKLFSLVDAEIPFLRKDPALAEITRQRFQDTDANYKSMKDLYTNPGRAAHDFGFQVQRLKDQHLRLIESLENDLKLPVPPELLAILRQPTDTGSPPNMLAEMVPAPLQPRFRMRPPNLGPRGLLGTPPGMHSNPAQDMRKRMEDMRRRALGRRGPGM